jgi:SAM-dependent methyltransferase
MIQTERSLMLIGPPPKFRPRDILCMIGPGVTSGGHVDVKSMFRSWIELVARFEPIRRMLFLYYEKKWLHQPVHPIDTEYGIRTSGSLPGFVLRLGYSFRKSTAHSFYAGSEPSVIRHALHTVPDHNESVFVDLGCGKGRALAVASEFPFRSIVGVEISPEVAKLAQENAWIVARNFPKRTDITVVNGDAVHYDLREGNLVIFLYNPFGKDLIRRVMANIESSLLTGNRKIYIIYYNPVWGAIFDASSMLTRIYAESIPYAIEENGFGPDSSDVIAIWKDAKSGPTNMPRGADREIVVTKRGLRVELAD